MRSPQTLLFSKLNKPKWSSWIKEKRKTYNCIFAFLTKHRHAPRSVIKIALAVVVLYLSNPVAFTNHMNAPRQSQSGWITFYPIAILSYSGVTFNHTWCFSLQVIHAAPKINRHQSSTNHSHTHDLLLPEERSIFKAIPQYPVVQLRSDQAGPY